MVTLTLTGTFRRQGSANDYLVPAFIALLFGGWTAYSVATEGPVGFWPEHIRNAWGNQIWFDLLMAFAMSWLLLLPRLRAVGMRPLPWLVLFLCTGSLGLFITLSRCLYLESHRPPAHR